ncbi:hypothetical protein CUJ84_pRLN1000574 (plasmid) [Rhizobium leguminosarum]|uniref:Uncharacterized protein n=1 Tax=Rhizobium leguminosarum TaxID=384 RepID=A0A2K9ZCR5_RHILE|nr:hypothetical protein CUJ84_pRLN1000574 [Rhizobium leguminosarum]
MPAHAPLNVAVIRSQERPGFRKLVPADHSRILNGRFVPYVTRALSAIKQQSSSLEKASAY